MPAYPVIAMILLMNTKRIPRMRSVIETVQSSACDILGRNRPVTDPSFIQCSGKICETVEWNPKHQDGY